MPGNQAIPTLPMLLNVLWRRRGLILVVTALGLLAGVVYGLVTDPLYRATAIVRPGIVSYGNEGAPVREWRHKDVVNWFDRQLYWSELREQPYLKDYRIAPRILTEFLPAGGLYQQSGDIIVLEHLATQPGFAVLIIDEAIATFNRQAGADTVASTLNLTRIGLEEQVAQLRAQQDLLEVEQERLSLQMAMQERADLRLAGRQAQETVAADNQHELAALGAVVAARADSALSAKQDHLRGMRRELGTMQEQRTSPAVGQYAQAVAALDIHAFAVQAHADSVRATVTRTRTMARHHELQRDEILHQHRLAVQDSLRMLALARHRTLPLQIARLEHEILAIEGRLAMLTPLERIGPTQVTERPVRPRKLRAIGILTTLAFGSSLFLALAVEYVSRNRTIIFARAER